MPDTEEKTETAPKARAPRTKAAESDATKMTIYERITAIAIEAGALAPEAKGGVPFAFRGIDGTVAHLAPLLNKYGVFLAPRVVDKNVSEREVYQINRSTGEATPSGRIVKTTDLTCEWDVYGPDGLGFTFSTAGLADDFADRSTAQASSVAYRIALLQLFHLPTHSREPEETGQEVLNATSGEAPAAPRGPKAVEAARAAAAPAAGTNLTRLQQEAKALGRKLGKGPEDLNALGVELAAGKDGWFGDAGVMAKMVEALKAEAGVAAE